MQTTTSGLKRILCVLALLLFAGQASATVFNVGTVGLGNYDFNNYVPNGPFSDTFIFELDGALEDAFVTFNIPLDEVPAAVYDIDNFTFGLFDSEDTLLSGVGDLGFSGVLASGGYYFMIDGVGVHEGTFGGYYSGVVNIAPVPEPATWALMLVGLALVGYQLRSRGSQRTGTLQAV